MTLSFSDLALMTIAIVLVLIWLFGIDVTS
jgi:hypothetical protein